MRGCFLILWVGVWSGMSVAISAMPPLTSAQQIQIQTAEDRLAHWDEAALYPLLENVLQWQILSKAGAMIPDWPALLTSPKKYRGQLFVIEGQLGGAPVAVGKLARSGPWTSKVQRWGVLYQVNPDAVAVVYVLPSTQTLSATTPLKVADQVQILGRFFKIWRHPDQDGQVTDYPVFVGKVIATEPRPTSSNSPGWLYLMLIIVAAIVWYMLRRASPPRKHPRKHPLKSPRPSELSVGKISEASGLPSEKLLGKLPKGIQGKLLGVGAAEALRRLALAHEDHEMSVVELKLAHHAYRIVIEPGLLGKLGTLVEAVAPHHSAAVIADAALVDSYQPMVVESLGAAKYKVLAVSMAAGENHKNLDTMRGLYDALLESHQERNSPIIALGGGVVGDTAGFVAASYLRGVPFIQCPTTLLAMVDASVGGKVGVNLPQGKNLIGAFYQPHLVAIDTNTLQSLPPRELRGGLAECVKHGIIRDESLFTWLEDNVDRVLALESDALVELVHRNVQIKATVVMADEKESGQRAHLNFGHTFAHAIEATQDYTAQGSHHHGEAVALGMVAATHLAVTAGRCEASVLERLVQLLDQIGLPTSADNLASTSRLLDVMRLDKKVADGRIRLVLPDKMGQVSIVKDQSDAAIEAAWEQVRTSTNHD